MKVKKWAFPVVFSILAMSFAIQQDMYALVFRVLVPQPDSYAVTDTPLETLIPLSAGDQYTCDNGAIVIDSDAPLERIKATSHKLKGIIDVAQQAFAWSVDVKTFEGFNSLLQREHFNENYMETTKHPNAIFTGKIIEQVDFNTPGVYQVRAKGRFSIHGIDQERIIKAKLEIKDGKILVASNFTILLADHDITIPRVVNQKIAEEIKIQVNAALTKKQ